MKKFLLILFGLASLSFRAHADSTDFNYISYSSYSDVATPGTILFSSSPWQLVGLVISSGAANGSITFYRSTTSVFTADIATQTVIGTDYVTFNTTPGQMDMYGIRNDSYTYINKQGAAKVTMFIRCFPNRKGQRVGVCPGLPASGRMQDKIEFNP